MKHIKKYISALAAAAMVFGASSCSDYLDVSHNFADLQTEDRIFAKKDYTMQWLAYCYSQLLGDNMDIAHRWMNISNFSDDMVFNEGNNGAYYRSWKLGEYQYLNTDANYQHSWSASYDGIRQASILIHNIQKNEELTEEEKVDVRGQARFVRAYLYFLLFRKYGPVPLMPDEGIDYTKSYAELGLPRNTTDEVVDFIASEMEEAAKDLPLTRNSTQVAMATRGAALAVRATALTYAASPLYNGNTEEADFVDDTGKNLIPQEYDESKWARAAAACKDVMNLGVYELNIAYKKESTDYAYPGTIIPPYNEKFSNEVYPNGWYDIDPFESYRSTFNGDVPAFQNKELIFGRGVNVKDQNGNTKGSGDWLVTHQLPLTAGGHNCHGLTLKQCDAYDMADGTPFDRETAPKKFTSDENKDEHPYDHLGNDVWMEYANREPRFYASVGFSGDYWSCTSSNQTQDHNVQVFYYRGEANGRSNSSERWQPTGIGMKKFVNPADCNINSGTIKQKVEPAIRYADILLMYAECLNELTGSYEVKSWDGSQTFTISRDVDEMHKGVKRVRMRAGVPDYSDEVYADQDSFRKKIKHERQVELFAENKRYYDLRRWKDAPKEEGEQVYGCNVYMSKNHAADFYTPVRVAYLQTAFSRKQYFWPIAFSELKRNARMTQAPGWEEED